jgi:hypothetical protein
MFYILENRKPVPIYDVIEWSKFLANAEARKVAVTPIEKGLRSLQYFLV